MTVLFIPSTLIYGASESPNTFCKLNFYLEVNIPSFAGYSEKQINSHI